MPLSESIPRNVVLEILTTFSFHFQFNSFLNVFIVFVAATYSHPVRFGGFVKLCLNSVTIKNCMCDRKRWSTNFFHRLKICNIRNSAGKLCISSTVDVRLCRASPCQKLLHMARYQIRFELKDVQAYRFWATLRNVSLQLQIKSFVLPWFVLQI